jgi:hypothetical protein
VPNPQAGGPSPCQLSATAYSVYSQLPSGDNIDTIKKKLTLIDTSKEVGLEVNAEETKYMLLSCHQTARQNHDRKIGNRCFENVAQFRYLGTTVAIQNLVQEEIKRRLNLGNACYHEV